MDPRAASRAGDVDRLDAGAEDGAVIHLVSFDGDPRVDAFIAALSACRARLGPDDAALVQRPLELGAPPPHDGIVVWFGGAGSVDGAERWAALLARSERPVLPVVDADAALASKLPAALLGFNVFFEDGFDDPAQATEALVDEVVAMAWQHRRRRKVFISYKRTDTEAAARRLYDRLGREGVEVFLDDATIPVGALFQPAFEAWLDDADALLLLLSPDFHASRWTMHEVTTALNGGLGLLALLEDNCEGSERHPWGVVVRRIFEAIER